MKVCIVRHGQAVSGDVYDHNRALTQQGHEQASAAGVWLAGQSFTSARLIASPYLRAQQTAEEITKTLNLPIETLPLLVPDAKALTLVDYLSQQQDDLILVSHLPLVGHIASVLIDGQVYEQPWSLAECWILNGDIAAAGCMTVEGMWYPVLAGI